MPYHPIEHYRELVIEWDVALAWAIIEQEQREPTGQVAIASLWAAMDGVRYVNEETALSDAIDLSIPLLIGTRREGYGGKMLLDGGHRVYKAHQQGCESLPYVLFSREETARLECSSHATSHASYLAQHACGADLTVWTQTFHSWTDGLTHSSQWFSQCVTLPITSPEQQAEGRTAYRYNIPVWKCLQCGRRLDCHSRARSDERVRRVKTAPTVKAVKPAVEKEA